MIVNGHVTMHISLNVYDLETDAVYVDRNGNVQISDDDQFLADWTDHWNRGIGELTGASTTSAELESEEEDGNEGDL